MSEPADGWSSTYGVSMPQIIYGTAWKKEKTAGLVEQAVLQGFRGIDTACQPKHYDEAGVGAGLAAALGQGIQRQDVYLQTKFTPLSGQDPQRIPYDPAADLAVQVGQSFQKSLENLRTEYVDCLVLHSPLTDFADLRRVWAAMEAVFDAGGTRQLGLSNCYDLGVLQRLHQTARIKPAVVQNRFYAKTGYDHAVREFCRENHMFYQSFWTLTANPHILAHEGVTALAAQYGRTVPQILFRYLSQNRVVPLTGTTSLEHMRQDVQIGDFHLSPDDCRILDALTLTP